MIESPSLTELSQPCGSMPTTRRIGGRSLTGNTRGLEYMNKDSVEKAFVLMLSLFPAVLTACCVSVTDIVMVAWR